MSNTRIYDAVSTTPKEAQREIKGGRMTGKTDINPMYRIRALTEQFGPCGIGWYYTTDQQWTVQAGDEVMCFVNISLYIKVEGEWSKPIFGTGGNMLLTKESKGLYASDEGYKMATTDALSVACKQLGIGADIYWSKGESKYSQPSNASVPAQDAPQEAQDAEQDLSKLSVRNALIKALCERKGMKMETFGALLQALQEDGKLPQGKYSTFNNVTFKMALVLVEDAANKTAGAA